MKNLNIIVLNTDEEFITWLDPEKVEIIETNKQKTQRSITITAPVEHEINDYDSNWFDAGNKIYINETIGIDSCLYVINQEASIDYWDKNEITIEAEEILVELNNWIYSYVDNSSLTVNKDNLSKWFGYHYDIGDVDTLDSAKNKINPAGTMSLMKLLRMIEDDTGYVFKTEYKLGNGNKINKKLHLKKPEVAGKQYDDFLDLNYNMDSLELVMDETSTYQAMAPELSLSKTEITKNTTSTTTSTTTNTTNTENGATTREELKKVIKNWKNLEVDYREYIPMIIEKGEDNSVKYTSYWYSPFEKKKGELYIYNTNYSGAKYKRVISNVSDKLCPPQLRMGFVSTSETNEYAIFNALANSLLDKIAPSFKLNVSLKDIQLILGDTHKGYNLYDKLYVRVPGFNYYIGCTVTETKKNPHLQGDNTITLESNVESVYLQENTMIECNDQKIPATVDQVAITGLLKVSSDENKPVGNVPVTVNISLKKGYVDEGGTSANNPVAENFKPETEYYVFTKSEINNMANIIFNNLLENKTYPKAVNMKAGDGKVYSVPFKWCRCIWYAYLQAFLISDEDSNIGNGKYPDSVEVHYYEDIISIFNNTKDPTARSKVKYYSSWFYYWIDEEKKRIKNKYFNDNDIVSFDTVRASDRQTDGDCVPTTISKLLAENFDYHSEKETRELLNTTIKNGKATGTDPNNIKNLSKWGYTVEFKNISNDTKLTNYGFNVIQETLKDPRYKISMGVDAYYLPYYDVFYGKGKTPKGSYHHISCVGAFVSQKGDDKGTKYVVIDDTNIANFHPYFAGITGGGGELFDGMQLIVKWDTLFKAICVQSESDKIVNVENNSSVKCINIIKELNNTKKKVTQHTVSTVVSSSVFDPENYSYTFKAKEIADKWKQIHINSAKNKSNIFNEKISMTDVKGQSYELTYKWMYSLYLHLLDTVTPSSENISDKNIGVAKGSDVVYYYNKNPDCDWHFIWHFSLTALESLDNAFPLEVPTGVMMWFGIINTQNFGGANTLDDLISFSKCLIKFEVEFTEENIKKYIHWHKSFGVIPCDNTVCDIIQGNTKNHAGFVYILEYFENQKELIKTCTVRQGNSRYYKPDVKIADSTKDGDNPWRTFTYSTLKKGFDAFNKYYGKNNKLLIVSYLSQSELEKL